MAAQIKTKAKYLQAINTHVNTLCKLQKKTFNYLHTDLTNNYLIVNNKSFNYYLMIKKLYFF